ncbi:MAG: TIGR00296 family protein [Thermoplasmata archaeon]|nr:TIGR00296 family protein [Thermoplasmata archaeon]
MRMYTDEEGRLAVRIARDVVERKVSGGVWSRQDAFSYEVPPKFHEKRGAFVTLNTYPAGELRGCIGYPYPILPLVETLIQSAINAATRDPRFFPLSPKELDSVVVEVSLLTPPVVLKAVTPKEKLDAVEVGVHGLIIEKGPYKGLLLPQVPVEWGWDVREFFEETCRKAGLPGNAWKEADTEISTFTAEIFKEKTPGGEVVREGLKR